MRCKPEQIYRRMCYLVERDQLYLDPHLSLIRLSAITGTNTLYLSRAINICTGHNFRSMLNDYRIKYAVELLKKNVAPRFSFKDFHQRCGYLSKSAFYTAFRQRLNMPPRSTWLTLWKLPIGQKLTNKRNKGSKLPKAYQHMWPYKI